MDNYIYYEGILNKGTITLKELMNFMSVKEKEIFAHLSNEIKEGKVTFMDFISKINKEYFPKESVEISKTKYYVEGEEQVIIVYLIFKKENLSIITEKAEEDFIKIPNFREEKMFELGMTEKERIKNIFKPKNIDGLTEYEEDMQSEFWEKLDVEKEWIYNNKELVQILMEAYIKASEYYANEFIQDKPLEKVKFL